MSVILSSENVRKKIADQVPSEKVQASWNMSSALRANFGMEVIAVDEIPDDECITFPNREIAEVFIRAVKVMGYDNAKALFEGKKDE